MSSWSEKSPTEMGLYWAYEALDPRDADVMLIFFQGNGHALSIEYNMSFEVEHFSHFLPMALSPPRPPPGVID